MATPTPQQAHVVKTITGASPPSLFRLYGGPGCAKSSTIAMTANNLHDGRNVLCLVFNRDAKESLKEKTRTGRVTCSTYAGLPYASAEIKDSYKVDYRAYYRCSFPDDDDIADEVSPVFDEGNSAMRASNEFVRWLATTDDVCALQSNGAQQMWQAVCNRTAPINEKATFKLLMLDPDLRQRVFGVFSMIIWDEAQDMDAVKWELSRRIYHDGMHVQVFAGDPYQCINTWAGAVLETFAAKRLHGLPTTDMTVSRTFRLHGSVLHACNSCARWMRSTCSSLPASLSSLWCEQASHGHHGYLRYSHRGDLNMHDVVRHLKENRIPDGCKGYLFFRTNMQLWSFLLRHFSDMMKLKTKYPRLMIRCDANKFKKMKKSVSDFLQDTDNAPSDYILCKLFELYSHRDDPKAVCARIMDIQKLQHCQAGTKRSRPIKDPRQRTLFDTAPTWTRDIDLLCTTVHTQKGRERPFVALMGDFDVHADQNEMFRVLFVAMSRCQHPSGLLVPARVARRVNSVTTVREVLMRTALGNRRDIIPRIEEYIGYANCSMYPVCRVRNIGV